MAILSIVLYYIVGSANISVWAAISVAMSISGLLITAALFVLTTGDHREITHSDGLFLITLFLFAFCLFFSELSWFLEGRPGAAWTEQVTEILGVICFAAMLFSFYRYLLSTVLSKKEASLKPLTIALAIYCGIMVLIAILNPLTGLMFTVDGAGYQVEGPFMFIVYGEILYPLWLLAFVWVFISIYDGNRRKLESKQHDIEVADSVFNGIVPKDGEGIVLTPEMQKLIADHTIPDAMKLSEMLTRERVRLMAEADK